MTERLAQIQRYPLEHGSLRTMGGLGALLIGGAGVLAVMSAGRPEVGAAGWGVAAILAGLGAILVGAAILRSRQALEISPEGVRFAGTTALVPWREIGGLSRPRIGDDFMVLDRSGRKLGIVPAALQDRPRVLQRLFEAAIENAPPPPATFKGEQGAMAWWPFVGAAVAMVAMIDLDRIRETPLASLILPAILLTFLIQNGRATWRASGTRELTVDRKGVRYRGRGEDWEMPWSDVRGAVLDLEAAGAGEEVLLITWTDQRWEPASLTGMDLVGVLSALRTHAPHLWKGVFDPDEAVQGHAGRPGIR